MHLLRSVLLLAIPFLIFSSALYLYLEVTVPPDWQPLLTMFPFLALFAGLFLGWRFNRTRVLWALLLIVLVDRILVLSTPFGREYVLAVAPVLVPLNLLLYNWWSERGLITIHGLLRFSFVAFQLGCVIWLYYRYAGETMAWLGRSLMSAGFVAAAPFSHIALLVIMISVVLLIVLFLRKAEALEGAFPWLLASLIAGLWWPEDFTFWGGVGAFLLVVALVESTFRMAFNDELTGLPARRAMNESLLKVGRRYSVAMVDVDHFKKVNDTHGHDVGDQVLRMVATCLRRVPGGGRAYRYGGEEFAVIFPNKDLERALPHLEELREAISRAGFVVRGRKRPKQKPENPAKKGKGSKMLHVTVSIGVAMRDEKNTTPEQLIKAADQALYRAKKGGRNRVCS